MDDYLSLLLMNELAITYSPHICLLTLRIFFVSVEGPLDEKFAIMGSGL